MITERGTCTCRWVDGIENAYIDNPAHFVVILPHDYGQWCCCGREPVPYARAKRARDKTLITPSVLGYPFFTWQRGVVSSNGSPANRFAAKGPTRDGHARTKRARDEWGTDQAHGAW